jgi:HSP20 family protein
LIVSGGLTQLRCRSELKYQKEDVMSDIATKLSVKTKNAAPMSTAKSFWQPFESLRDEIDHVFDDFTRRAPRQWQGRSVFDIEPLWRHDGGIGVPAVDGGEKDDAYRVTAELPGLDEKDIEVSVADDVLTIKAEKKEEKEQEGKNYYLSERRYGLCQRAFQLPAGVDQSKIEASFQKGVLSLTLPKLAEAQKKEKKIDIKAK